MNVLLQEFKDRIRVAAETHQTLSLQGHGSKAFYGETPQGDTLDVSGYSGVLSYEPSELVVTARAGTPLRELEALLAEKGQCLPFEPPHFGAAGGTVGGMVASGLSGPARVSVGSVRDYVLGVTMLNGRAEELRFGGQVMKNVAGYDVSRVMAGAMGTLGLITEVSLKVLPKAPAEATLMMALPQAQALQQLHRWMAQPLPLNASCWVHDDSAQPAQDFLFVRLRGAQAAVEAACLRMASDVQQQGFAVSRMDNAGAAGDWQACADQQLPFFQPEPTPSACLWRLSLPPTAPVLDLPSSPLIEWHGGLRWLWAPASEAAQLRELVQRHGGHATLWRTRPGHGAEDRRVGVFTPLPPVQHKLQQTLQAEFDPHAVFKTGRLGL